MVQRFTRGARDHSIVAAPSMSRRTRNPEHSWNIRFKPFALVPCMLAPVLPGETLKSATLQARCISDPIRNRLNGWWLEFYLFYVKLRDLDDRDELTQMLINPEYDHSALVDAAASDFYHHAGGINYTEACLKRVTEEYFRDEGEAWDTYLIGNYPIVRLNRQSWLDSVADASEFDTATTEMPQITVGGDGLFTAREVEDMQRRYEVLRMNNLTNMDFEDYLAAAGIRQPQAENHVPELIRYVRDWKYPIAAIDPADGSAANAVTWSISERVDKNRIFREPGFIFGVTCARPKVYFANQGGQLAHNMTEAFDWMPAVLRGDANVGWRQFAAGANGPLASNTNAYWVDFRDLYEYGDQYIVPGAEANDARTVALPTTALQKKYPTNADVIELFVDDTDTTTGTRMRMDGVCHLNIATPLMSDPS